MKDLLAIATIRRLLLELGYELIRSPEYQLAGTLEIWIHTSREDLGGVSPFQTLQTEGGESRVRACLMKMLGT